MLFKKKISLLIPCKNEEAALYSLLKKVPSYVDEIVVVDNNSSDNTPIVAGKHGTHVYKEKRSVNGIGYGFAHQTGMKRTTGDYIIAMDGDDTYPVEKIEEIVTYMEENDFDFISCSRLPLTEAGTITTFRQMGIRILNFIAAVLYGYCFNDLLTGMWVMRKDAMHKLQVTSGDWNFSPEVKLAALTHPQIRFSEYHIPYKLRINGTSKLCTWKTGVEHVVYLIEKRLTAKGLNAKLSVNSLVYRIAASAKGFVALFLAKTF